jgi:Flp pilus assembly protein TadG
MARNDSKLRGKRGFTLITTGACAIAMLGMLGLAVDLGRVYVAKNEMQAYTDSASLAAAVELDGTAAGISRAQSAVASNTNRWNLGSATFSGTQTQFGTNVTGPWQSSPSPTTNVRFVRVRASGTLSLLFLPAVSSTTSSNVSAVSVAGQVVKQNFNEGLFPFSPLAHTSTPPDFGYTPGQWYTLRWGSNPRVNVNVCEGDNAQPWVDQAKAGSSSERGYIEETSSAIIRMAIEQDYMSNTLTVGQPVNMTGGNKQTQRDSIVNRINQDTDPASTSYAQYEAAGTGNGRRLVVVAINNADPNYIVLGFHLFFLLQPSEYDSGGNKPFCAEYVGPYVQGSQHKGAGGAGAYVVRLVQ